MDYFLDKNGNQIKEGQNILIQNLNKSVSELHETVLNDGKIMLKRKNDGKMSNIKTYIDAIYAPSDSHGNWIEIIL